MLVLLPTKQIDGGNARSFESILIKVMNSGERHVVVDLSRLDFINSSGLRVLLIAVRALKASRGTLILCAMKNGPRTHPVYAADQQIA